MSVSSTYRLTSPWSAQGLVPSSHLGPLFLQWNLRHFAEEGWVIESTPTLSDLLHRLAHLSPEVVYFSGNTLFVNPREGNLPPEMSNLSGATLILRFNEVEACAQFEFGISEHLSSNIAAKSLATIKKVSKAIREAVPLWIAPVRPEKPQQYVNFWYMSQNGPQANPRLLDVVQWDGIQPNYTAEVREALATFVRPDYRPHHSGQIMLFTGPPGVGKTFTIRALAWEWRRWCSIHYVMDPATLLSGGAGYLHSLMFAQESPASMIAGPESTHQTSEEGSEEEGCVPLPIIDRTGRWRLIVLEDTGELIGVEARDIAGPGLSRLLNAADGLLGQGSRVMFLITTNEPVEKLHPAVTRAGRCAVNLSFAPLTADESNIWLIERGYTGEPIKESKTIADLFALVQASEQVVRKHKGRVMGFK